MNIFFIYLLMYGISFHHFSIYLSIYHFSIMAISDTIFPYIIFPLWPFQIPFFIYYFSLWYCFKYTIFPYIICPYGTVSNIPFFAFLELHTVTIVCLYTVLSLRVKGARLYVWYNLTWWIQ